MARYKIIVAYDGTDFFGWQQQKDQPSIAQTLQDAFKHAFNIPISILGASRTDAGVHALGQVASFNTELNISPEKMRDAWNHVLPPSISIQSLEHVADDYNPHHHVKNKFYQYLFFQERPLPMHTRYGWYYHYPVNIEKLKHCLNVFLGTHDFRSFCTGDDRENTIRTITSATVEPASEYANAYRITIAGPGFLHHMVRRIVGACLHVASRDTLEVNELEKALKARNPAQILPNAPAHGLTLVKIIYTPSE